MENIVIDNLSKSYGDKHLFDHFNLTFEAGKTYCLFAPSGRGKTTLLRMLLGLEQPDSGSITGVPAFVSTVFQEDRLCEGFSALENVMLVMDDSIPRSRKRNTATSLLSELGLSDSLRQPVSQLSRGMRRRVSLARAFAFSSSLIILDEPFEGLDAENIKRAAIFIKEQQKSSTLLLVSHSLEEAEALGAEVLRIS